MITEKISVRELVEFVYRSGDIDSTYTSSKGNEVMMKGISLHNKVQKERKAQYEKLNLLYEKEINLKISVDYKNISFQIKGRLDGMIVLENKVIIEEIKSTGKNFQNLNFDSNLSYKAQAMIYSFIYATQNKIETTEIFITYINNKTEEQITFSKEFSILELSEFFLDTLEKYYVFAKLAKDNEERLIVSGNNMLFPFPTYRKNQREFMKAVFVAIKEKKKLFGEAPTGVGKTLSTMFPAVKNLCQSFGTKIFYLTSKTITRTVAEESLILMKQCGLQVNSVTFTAKEKICTANEVKCTPFDCERAKGHFNRINDAILDIILKENIISREIILNYSEKHKVCPFEFQLDLASFSHIVICDYNYVYNPRVQLKRYFQNEKNNFIILVDEAHNLENRAREMFSAALDKSEILKLKKLIENKKIINVCKEINTQMLGLSTLILSQQGILENLPTSLINLLLNLKFLLDEWLQENQLHIQYKIILEIYFNIDNFIKTSSFYDDKYRTLIKKDKKNITLTLLCLDPSTRFNLVNILCRSVIYFSATLTPVFYFSNLFGGTKSDLSIKLSSPFETKNSLILADTSVSTYYKDRQHSYSPISDKIYNLICAKTGNYFVFFPSYDFMNCVFNEFVKKYSHIKIICQVPNMNEGSKEWFLNQFREENKEITVAFLVLGGIFSEGINLQGKRLIGVCIVGVGIGSINFYDNIIKEHFDEIYQMGYEFAYMYPGMNKVLQGAGRLIRGETDFGVILFLDNRYSKTEYKNLFPAHYNHLIESNDDVNTKELLNNFWNKKN